MNFLRRKYKEITLFLVTFWYVAPVKIFAEGDADFSLLKNPLCTDGGPCIDDLDSLIKKFLEVVLIVAVPLVAVAIIYSGFLLVSGAVSGNPSKIKDGKSALKWSLIGGSILLAAWVIAETIDATVTNLGGGS